MIKKILFVFTTIVISFFLVNTPVEAIQIDGMSVVPALDGFESENPWFEFDLENGEQVEAEIIVSNISNEVLELKLYAADGTTTEQGDFALELEKQDSQLVGRWVELATESLELDPGESQNVSFKLTVPDDNKLVGDIFGGIIVQKAELEDTESDIKINNRLGMRIYVNVAGEEEVNLAIDSVEKTQTGFKLTIINRGNVIIDPDLQISSKIFPLGKSNQLTFDSLGQVFPDEQREVEVEFTSENLWFGRETVVFDLTDESTLLDSYQLSEWVIDWNLLIIILIVSMAIGGGIWYYRSREKNVLRPKKAPNLKVVYSHASKN